MILCLDCGNTRLKWGMRDGQRWVASGALLHADIPKLAAALSGLSVPNRVLACNVASEEQKEAIESALGQSIQWIKAVAESCGVSNCYDDPQALGADRWAALIGAHAMHRGNSIVVLVGTATTVDVLDARGNFCGGLILPGISLMTESLAQGTARLPSAAGTYRTLPRNTRDAIASGATHATLGAIERMYEQLAPGESSICLLSGGAAGFLQPHLRLPYQYVDNLVLEGLATMAAGEASDAA
jgi:type III pantothenate kinase